MSDKNNKYSFISFLSAMAEQITRNDQISVRF